MCRVIRSKEKRQRVGIHMHGAKKNSWIPPKQLSMAGSWQVGQQLGALPPFHRSVAAGLDLVLALGLFLAGCSTGWLACAGTEENGTMS
jgi:hypothetical protein